MPSCKAESGESGIGGVVADVPGILSDFFSSCFQLAFCIISIADFSLSRVFERGFEVMLNILYSLSYYSTLHCSAVSSAVLRCRFPMLSRI